MATESKNLSTNYSIKDNLLKQKKLNQKKNEMKNSKNLCKTILILILQFISLILIINLFLQMSSPTNLVSARYLPTRSNTFDQNLRRQEIKEILRMLLELPSNDESAVNRDSALLAAAVAPGSGGQLFPVTQSGYYVGPFQRNLDSVQQGQQSTGSASSSRTKRSINAVLDSRF